MVYLRIRLNKDINLNLNVFTKYLSLLKRSTQANFLQVSCGPIPFIIWMYWGSLLLLIKTNSLRLGWELISYLSSRSHILGSYKRYHQYKALHLRGWLHKHTAKHWLIKKDKWCDIWFQLLISIQGDLRTCWSRFYHFLIIPLTWEVLLCQWWSGPCSQN